MTQTKNDKQNKIQDLQNINPFYFEHYSRLIVFKELKENLCIQREKLWFTLDQEWEKLIRIHINTNLSSRSTFECLIYINNATNQIMLDKITSFSKLRPNPTNFLTKDISFAFYSKLNSFCVTFLQIFDKYLIHNDFAVVTSIEKEYTIIRLFDVDNLDEKTKKSSPIDILETKLQTIILLFNQMHKHFFKFSVWIYDTMTNKESLLKIKLMNLFFIFINESFFKIVYEKLIKNVIPVQCLDASLEIEITTKINEFQGSLKSVEFDSKSLANNTNLFESNLEEIFIRKKCKFIYEYAQSVMKNSDLIFETSQYEIIYNDYVDDSVKELKELYKTTKSNDLLDDLMNIIKSSSNNLCITKTTQMISKLIYQTLNDAYFILTEGNQKVKNVLLLCIICRNIFELYINIIPSYHENNIKTLPIIPIALYNDISYMAISCLTLSHQYKTLIESIGLQKESKLLDCSQFDKNELTKNFSFIDIAFKLSHAGK
jgi:hypothetical protein